MPSVDTFIKEIIKMKSIKRQKMKKFYKAAMPKAKCDWKKDIHKYLTVSEIDKLLHLTKKYNIMLAFEKKSMLVENSQITFLVTPKTQTNEHIWEIKEAKTIEYDDNKNKFIQFKKVKKELFRNLNKLAGEIQ